MEVIFADGGEDTVLKADLLQPDLVILEQTMSGYAGRLSGTAAVIILQRLDPQDDVVCAILAVATAVSRPFV